MGSLTKALARSLATAGRLLLEAESTVPIPVTQTIRFFVNRGVWYKLSRNREALGCRDAAHKRWRLGHQGIPLWDELKSFFGCFINARGRPQLFVAHCRADQRLDMQLLARVLEARAEPRSYPRANYRDWGRNTVASTHLGPRCCPRVRSPLYWTLGSLSPQFSRSSTRTL